jgi:hypothetical protein
MSKRLKTYEVTGRLVLVVSISIKADSLADAVEQSKELQERDFVAFEGDFMDGSLAIAGVTKSGCWNTEQEDGK